MTVDSDNIFLVTAFISYRNTPLTEMSQIVIADSEESACGWFVKIYENKKGIGSIAGVSALPCLIAQKD